MAKETDPGIIAGMFSSRSKRTRVLAACLPLCLVWVFVACVSLCAAQAGTCEKPSTEAAGVSQEANHCPITEAPNAVIPERQAFSPQVIIQEILTAPSPSVVIHVSLSADSSPVDSSSDPPLKLLRALRI
jgi:hypothetical protein